LKIASESGERIRVRCHAPSRLRTGRDADVAAAHRVGLRVAKGFDWQSLDESTRPGLAQAATTTSAIIEDTYANAAEAVRGWRFTMGGGQAGFDYALGAAMPANLTGANVPEEIRYPNTRVDDQGVLATVLIIQLNS
jgi:hypothetical protein